MRVRAGRGEGGGAGEGRDVRRAPFLARVAEAEVVGEVGHDLALGDDVLVPRDERVADVGGDCAAATAAAACNVSETHTPQRARQRHTTVTTTDDDKGGRDPPLRTPVTGMTSNSFLSQGSKRRVK